MQSPAPVLIYAPQRHHSNSSPLSKSSIFPSVESVPTAHFAVFLLSLKKFKFHVHLYASGSQIYISGSNSSEVQTHPPNDLLCCVPIRHLKLNRYPTDFLIFPLKPAPPTLFPHLIKG